MFDLPPVVLLDLDDTILRFSAGQPDAWALVLAERFSAPQLDELLNAIALASDEFWSDPARAFWGRMNLRQAREQVALAALSQHGVAEDVARAIGAKMTDAKHAQMRPFDGAFETLQALRAAGHRLGLLTNGCSTFQRAKLSRFQLEQFFELVLIEGELGFGKPDARVFQQALRFFGCDPQDAVMVGDNLAADVAGAQAVGVRAIWHDCDSVGIPAESFVVPDAVITRLTELC